MDLFPLQWEAQDSSWQEVAARPSMAFGALAMSESWRGTRTQVSQQSQGGVPKAITGRNVTICSHLTNSSGSPGVAPASLPPAGTWGWSEGLPWHGKVLGKPQSSFQCLQHHHRSENLAQLP